MKKVLGAVVTRIDPGAVAVLDGGNRARGASDGSHDPIDTLTGTQHAVDCLVGVDTMADLIDRAAGDTCRLGFTRALYSDIGRRVWLPYKAYSRDDPDFASRFVEFGIAHSRPMAGWMVESEMLLSGNAILVSDVVANPRVNRRLLRFSKSESYVAAPVQAWGLPVGMLHADRYPDCSVDELDRRVLGIYARALGLAIERCQLAERLRTIHRVTTYGSGVDFGGYELVDGGSVGARKTQAQSGAQLASERLSEREWEVLRSIALGMTNAQIAAALFLAEGTIKVHVKRIFRKLGAANRTEAAVLYHHLTRRGA